MAAKHQQAYVVKANIVQIRNVICSSAFENKLNISFKSENPTPTGAWFRFHHGTTFTSWGEKITITLTSLPTGDTEVSILSECGMPTQVIDWGKNKQNVKNIYSCLINYLSSQIPPQQNQFPQNQFPQNQFPQNQFPQNQMPPQQNSNSMNGAQGNFARCSSCGSVIEINDNFCGKCGFRIK